MALVESIDIPLKSSMPRFSLMDTDGKLVDSEKVQGSKGTLITFTCNHCPYAIALWPRLIRLFKKVSPQGISFLAINPNINPAYPDDSPEKMKIKKAEWGIDFPYLIDAKQEVAKKFQAQCTPDIYLFDSKGLLVYHGRFDDNWKDESQVKSKELEAAIENLLNNKEIPQKQIPSMGCSIKWL